MAKEKGSTKKAGKNADKIPWTLVSGIVAFIILLVAVLFTFSGPSKTYRRGGAEGDYVQPPPANKEQLEQYEQLVKSGDEQLSIGAAGIPSARELYEQAVALLPEHPLAHFQLGRIAEEEGDLQTAVNKYYLVLSYLNPTMREGMKTVHTHLALALLNQNNITGSIEHWKAAVEQDARDASLRFSLANALVLTGDLTTALKHFKRASELDKKEAKYLLEYGRHLKLVNADDQQGDKLIEDGLRKGNEQQLFSLGMYLRSKDAELAERTFETILQRFPNHPGLGTVYYSLGQLYGEQGRKEDEDALYERGVEAKVFPSKLQRPMFAYPKLTSLPSNPFGDEALLTKLAEPIALLESNAAKITEELKDFINDPSKLEIDSENLGTEGDWRQLAFVRNGVARPNALANFSTTNEVLQKIREEFSDDMPRASMELSILGGPGHIKPHCGPVNFRVRLHLGLDVPAEAGIRVGTEEKKWENGKVLVIDDSFEHEVWNNATTPRAILIVDVWHPALEEQDKDMIRQQFGYNQPQYARQAAGAGH